MVITTLPPTTQSIQRESRDGLQRIVDGLTSDPETALARIWMLQSDSACDICRQQSPRHPRDEVGLHLAASAGRSRNSSEPQTWDRLDGMSHRFPLQSQKIGRIGATGEPVIVRQTSGDSSLTNPLWLAQEGIQSFFGYPITDGGRIFGVLGVFLRRELTEPDLIYLRQIAGIGAQFIIDADHRCRLQTQVDTLRAENRALSRRTEFDSIHGPLINASAAARKWEEQIRLAAQHESPVLIRGERGSGKEYTARRIHALSKVAHRPLLVVNASDLDVAFLEQQLMEPHDRNNPADASSGSDQPTVGTLLIESVEQASRDVQNWLTTFLIHPTTGPHQQRRSNQFRILAESAAELDHEIAAGRLQNDFYCALSVTEIRVPPLRARSEDLPGLSKNIVERFCEREQRSTLEIPVRLLEEWTHADWPGNVRELELVLTRCLWRATNDDVEIRDVQVPPSNSSDDSPEILRVQDLRRNEKSNLLACLKQCDWKIYGSGGAAEMLGMKPTTLIYRMKILGIRRPTR